MHIYILMGVSGVGKTTIGKVLAEKLGVPFRDADDFHTTGNIEKMKQGIALEDRDRQEWLEALSRKIKQWHREKGVVLACSALKESYREKLRVVPDEALTWIFLHSDYQVIHDRLSSRSDHFFEPRLLQSQFETLEAPEYGLHIDVHKSEKEIVEEIMEKIEPRKKGGDIGIIGLGVMGKSLALNFASHGFRVSVYNRNIPGTEEDIAQNFANEHAGKYEFRGFDQLAGFLNSLEHPRKILMMIPAGDPVDGMIEDLKPFLERGDILMDGGNSHYKDTQRRVEVLEQAGIHFFGIGISGGEEGARTGPSIMPGGSQQRYSEIGKLLEVIAARDAEEAPCCTYLGPGGSGHFVKMLHNGIEYGEMQLIAETYYLLRFHHGLTPEAIAGEFEKWNRQLRSYLLEITIDILRKKEEGELLLDKILDAAKQKGTGGWSTMAALELGVPLDTITAAVMARNISARKKERLLANERYRNRGNREPVSGLGTVFGAYRAASVINHAIGFDLLSQASKEFNWQLELSEIARIWTNGCIIRSALMEELGGLFDGGKDQEHLLLHPRIQKELENTSSELSLLVGSTLQGGIPVPVMAAALNYFLNYTTANSSANMIQAQRDYFGAHTYERTDKPRDVYFHTTWKE